MRTPQIQIIALSALPEFYADTRELSYVYQTTIVHTHPDLNKPCKSGKTRAPLMSPTGSASLPKGKRKAVSMACSNSNRMVADKAEMLENRTQS
jgi:hypothetical protein